jgi:hypothetical protein
MNTVEEDIASLTARLQEQRKGTFQDKLAAMTDRPRRKFPNLDDRNWVTRFIARSGVIEGGEVAEPVKRKRSPQIFRERDVTRAIAGHMKAGLAVAGTKFTRDGFIVFTGKPEVIDLAPKEEAQAEANEWDRI